MKINKMLGFYELPKTGLPCIHWQKFNSNMKLDPNLLWTVRTAILTGDDLSLPRKVGVSSGEAYEFAKLQLDRLQDRGLVVVYPYFIADKSGTLEIRMDRIIIEAVYKDLWNFVSENDKDITIIITDKEKYLDGKGDFFKPEELEELIKQATKVKGKFRDSLIQGNSILLEWSFAFNTNKNGIKLGQKYLVFYEIREL